MNSVRINDTFHKTTIILSVWKSLPNWTSSKPKIYTNSLIVWIMNYAARYETGNYFINIRCRSPQKGSFRYFLKTTETLRFKYFSFSLVAIRNSSLLLRSTVNEFGEIYFVWRWWQVFSCSLVNADLVRYHFLTFRFTVQWNYNVFEHNIKYHRIDIISKQNTGKEEAV